MHPSDRTHDYRVPSDQPAFSAVPVATTNTTNLQVPPKSKPQTSQVAKREIPRPIRQSLISQRSSAIMLRIRKRKSDQQVSSLVAPHMRRAAQQARDKQMIRDAERGRTQFTPQSSTTTSSALHRAFVDLEEFLSLQTTPYESAFPIVDGAQMLSQAGEAAMLDALYEGDDEGSGEFSPDINDNAL